MRGVKTRKNEKTKKALMFVAIFIVTLILLNSVHNVYRKNREAAELLVKMQSETSDLKERKIFLASLLERLATVDGVKFEIRKKLNVAAVGEKVAVIVEQNNNETVSAPTVSPWQELKSLILSWFR